ncbi:MAG: DegT/DnrJ/EryC1/StrS family aminotransferase [Acidimicrobiales bacterium]
MIELDAEHGAYFEELSEAVVAVLRHGKFILGPEVAAFEQECAAYLGVKHAVGVNSGTDALVLSLRALGVGPGVEVLTTPFTFFATAEAISAVGAAPVFVDIMADTMNLDVAKAAAAITANTKAIIPVHLFGQPCDMDDLVQLADSAGLGVIEDAAQAFGARHGSRCAGAIGDLGAFSFFPSKTLGGIGDGGLVTTDDDGFAEHVRMLRFHGSRRKYFNEEIGYNSRLDTIQAAALRVKLRRVDDANKSRQRIAERYEARFADVAGITPPPIAPGRTHVFHQYTVRITRGRREAVAAALAAQEIASMVYYPVPVHKLPVYAELRASCPRAERAAEEVLSLPISPAMSDDAIERVADAVVAAIG